MTTMKKYLQCITAPLLILMLILGGCGNGSGQASEGQADSGSGADSQPLKVSDESIQADYEKINVPEDLTAEGSRLCYAGENSLVFATGKRNGASTGPLLDTEKLVIYDTETGARRDFPIYSAAYICEAMPYQNGLLYSDYAFEGDNDGVVWNVMYADDSGSVSLDSGRCSYFDSVPAFAQLAGKPFYLYENEGNEKGLGIKRVAGMKPEPVLQNSGFTAEKIQLCSKGEKLSFTGEKENSRYWVTCSADGDVSETELQGVSVFYGAAGDYALCRLSEPAAAGEFCLGRLDLKTGCITEFETDIALYPVWAGETSANSGARGLCVNQSCLYQLDYEAGMLYPVTLPSKILEEKRKNGKLNVLLTANEGDRSFTAEFSYMEEEKNHRVYYKLKKF